MNVADDAGGHIIVQYQIHILHIDASWQQLRANQQPNCASSEVVQSFSSLKEKLFKFLKDWLQGKIYCSGYSFDFIN